MDPLFGLTSITLAGLFAMTSATVAADSTHYADRSEYLAPKALTPVTVDGIANEAVWEQARWQELRYRWLGDEYSPEDFQGRYKVVWSDSKVYVLGEFTDDVLLDIHRDPLVQYWDDDCLEIFVDEDFSGGDHQYNHNAFAYHIALDNQAIDIGTDKQARNYSHHVDSRWKQQNGKIIWEIAIDIYTDAYQDDSDSNAPIGLSAGKVMGFMVAYCDNDRSELRENFIGSEFAPGDKKDRGWIDAGLFGSLVLVD
jgi:hypothetical protein